MSAHTTATDTTGRTIPAGTSRCTPSTMPDLNRSPITPGVRHHRGMGFLDASGLAHTLPDGRELFREVAFRVSAGNVVALIGANGVGKSTLLRQIAGGDGVRVEGGLAVMPQFIGSVRDDRTVR